MLPEDGVVHQRRPCLRQLRQGSAVGSPRSVADRVLVLTQLPLAVQFVGALPAVEKRWVSRSSSGETVSRLHPPEDARLIVNN